MTVSESHNTAVGSTSSGLVERVKARDEAAWSRLVTLYGPLVNYWVAKAGLQDADARDVFQDVFVAVACGIEGFRRDRPGDTFRGWLRVIVRRRVADHFRRGQVQPTGEGGSDAHARLHQWPEAEDDDSDAGEAEALRQLRLRGLELVRLEFEERTWRMFWRSTVDGRPTREVAEEFGVSPNAVRMARSRVLRRLREELGESETR